MDGGALLCPFSDEVRRRELARQFVSKRLDAVEALKPGTGSLEAGLRVLPQWAGAYVDAETRLDERWALFGEAWAGKSYGANRNTTDYGAAAGVRFRW